MHRLGKCHSGIRTDIRIKGELIALDCIASNERIINARIGVRRVQPMEIAFEDRAPANSRLWGSSRQQTQCSATAAVILLLCKQQQQQFHDKTELMNC